MKSFFLLLVCCFAWAGLHAQTQDSLVIALNWRPPIKLNQPLCFLNGKKFSADSLNLINPNSIESIDVIKGPDAQERYGDEGKNGVLLIKQKDIVKPKED